jgi:hypothetical protein
MQKNISLYPFYRMKQKLVAHFGLPKLIVLLVISLFSHPLLFANNIKVPDCYQFDARLDTIKRNRGTKRLFIETGTAGGQGVFTALLSGFEEIHSIELLKELYDTSIRRIGNRYNVHLYLGDSASMLTRILPEIHEPALFWLDAHFGDRPSDNCPILRELEAIATHPIKTHTILIDDVRCFGTSDYDYISVDQVCEAIYRINPNYEITFEDGYVKNDVLVAKVNPANHACKMTAVDLLCTALLATYSIAQ